MIVKVQISLASSDKQQRVLVYDKSMKHYYEAEPGKNILALMKGENKKFFHAKYIGTKIIIGDEAPWQNW